MILLTLENLTLRGETELTPIEREVRRIVETVQTKTKTQRAGVDFISLSASENGQFSAIIRTNASFSTIQKRFRDALAVVIRTGYVHGSYGCYEIVFYPQETYVGQFTVSA